MSNTEPAVSAEHEALSRIEKAIGVFEAAMAGEFAITSLSSLDTYRKLVAEASRLRVVVESKRRPEPVTRHLRIAAGQDFNPNQD